MLIQSEGMLPIDEFLYQVQSTELSIVQNNKKISFYNEPAAFDLEASSFYNEDEKLATMYIWQFGISGLVTYGRTWNEFKKFFNILQIILSLSNELRLIVYVHNLQYDFQWFRKYFQWDHVFLLEAREPVYARIGGLEFRDSLILSGGVSLAYIGEHLQKYKVEKMVGDLDYNLVRSSNTPLTEKELKYCENDIRVLMSYIQEKIEQDGDITQIPLTNTGYVRRYARKACFPGLDEIEEK